MCLWCANHLYPSRGECLVVANHLYPSRGECLQSANHLYPRSRYISLESAKLLHQVEVTTFLGVAILAPSSDYSSPYRWQYWLHQAEVSAFRSRFFIARIRNISQRVRGHILPANILTGLYGHCGASTSSLSSHRAASAFLCLSLCSL